MSAFVQHVRQLLTEETVMSIGGSLTAMEEVIQQAVPLEAMDPQDDLHVPIHLMSIHRPAVARTRGSAAHADATALIPLDLPGQLPSGGTDFTTEMAAWARSLADDARTPRLDDLHAPEGPAVGLLIVVGRRAFGPVEIRRQRVVLAVLANGTVLRIVRSRGEAMVRRSRGTVVAARDELAAALWRIGQALHAFPGDEPPLPTARPR
ncbi:hypothetical protein [Kitasatospora azatica]|uniref:hypothetical protein n=1 Tax=Kitasatospora azatica TaxID=58347 RepID=UPI0005620736|nr:hypothetical protein [Kitasatospora azatica]